MDVLSGMQKELALGAASNWVFVILVCFIIVVQIGMLLYGRHIGISVSSKEMEWKRPKVFKVHRSDNGGPLLRMYTVLASPTHCRTLTSSSKSIGLACIPNPDALALANDIQQGRVSHVLVQQSMLIADGAILPDANELAPEHRHAFEMHDVDMNRVKRFGDLVTLSFVPYGSTGDTNERSLAIAGMMAGLVPIDSSASVPGFIASAKPLPSQFGMKNKPYRESAKADPPVAVVVLAWSWNVE